MAACTIPEQTIERTIAFHGHSCPGLAIGIRAAELALRALDNPPPEEMVTVTETDMCGVDAIQFLTGCTLGKGNLIHRDFGKMAFSFYDRRNGKGIRAVLNQEARGPVDEEYAPLMDKIAAGTVTEAEMERVSAIRSELKRRMLALDLDRLFSVTELTGGSPRRARILASLVCDSCGESAMESRTRRLGGKTLCIPCFEAVEQKV